VRGSGRRKTELLGTVVSDWMKQTSRGPVVQASLGEQYGKHPRKQMKKCRHRKGPPNAHSAQRQKQRPMGDKSSAAERGQDGAEA